MPELEIEFGAAIHRVEGPTALVLETVALMTGESHDLILAKALGQYANSLTDMSVVETP